MTSSVCRCSSIAGDGRADFGSCCTLDDLHDARRVASALGFPHYILNFEQQFQETVISNFVREYASGRTPLPCAHCNSDLKFSTLLDRARGLGAEHVATGHYARVERSRRRALAAQAQRRSRQGPVVLPVLADAGAAGGRSVPGRIADEAGRARPGAPARAGRRRQAGQPGDLLRARRRLCGVRRQPHAGDARGGAIVDEQGRTLGSHEGVHRFTIGQRKGLGIATGHAAVRAEDRRRLRRRHRRPAGGTRAHDAHRVRRELGLGRCAGRLAAASPRRSAIAIAPPRDACARSTAIARSSSSTSRRPR